MISMKKNMNKFISKDLHMTRPPRLQPKVQQARQRNVKKPKQR